MESIQPIASPLFRIKKARWIRVLLCGATAAILVLLLLWVWNIYTSTSPALCPRLAEGWISSVPWWALPILVLALCLFRSIGNLGLCYRFQRLATLPGYPPLWVGAWVACLLVALTLDFMPAPHPWAWVQAALGPGLSKHWMLTTLWLTPFVAGGVSFAWAWREVTHERSVTIAPQDHGGCRAWWTERQRKFQPPQKKDGFNPSVKAAPLTISNGLDVWLSTDRPIERIQEDRMGHQVIARRIARRLCEEPPQSQAVVGPLGSGKTSLGNLVELALREQTKFRVRLVRVALWPYANVEAALTAILQKIIEELEREAALPHLRRLPRHYVEGAKAAGGWLTFLAWLLDGPRKDLPALIRELDETACALDLRLVIWIEDLERFVGAANRSDPIELSAEEQRELGPLRALVHALGSSPNHHLAAVFATTHLQHFDLGKVARYIETLETIRPEQMTNLLQAFLGEISRSSNRILDVADPRPLGGALNQDDDRHLALMDHLCRGAFGMSTRKVKQGLRLAMDFWQRFPGEVDLEDLVIVELLRNEPEWLEKQEKESLGFPNNPGNGMHRAFLEKELLDESNQTINWWWLRNPSQKPQAVLPFACLNRVNPRRYWQRILSEPDIPEEDSDQGRYRRVLEAAQAGDQIALLNMLEQPQDAEALVACAWHLGFDEVLRLWTSWVQRIQTGEGCVKRRSASFQHLLAASLRLHHGREWKTQSFHTFLMQWIPVLAQADPTMLAAMMKNPDCTNLANDQMEDYRDRLTLAIWQAMVTGHGERNSDLTTWFHNGSDLLLRNLFQGANRELWWNDFDFQKRIPMTGGETAWAAFWRTLVDLASANPDRGLRVLGALLIQDSDGANVILSGGAAALLDASLADKMRQALEFRGADTTTVAKFWDWIAPNTPLKL